MTAVCTICVTGATPQVETRIAAILDEPDKLEARWAFGDHASADLLVVDSESVSGHMDWLRAKSAARRVVVCTSQPDAHAGERCLRKPLLATQVVTLLNEVGRELAARPATTAAAESVAAARPAAREPVGSLRALLDDPAANRMRLAATGLPPLLLDPSTRTWRSPSSLKGLSEWCTRSIAADEREPLSDAAFEAAGESLPAHPYARLTWLAHLLGGNGALAAGLAPSDLYRLSRWPQSERDFPRHFRIATVLLKQAATPVDIAAQSGASTGEVADFINAYHALGYVEVVRAQGAAQPASRGLFERMRKSASN